MEKKQVERRKQYRLPFEGKAIYSDGQQSGTAYAVNISRGGLFIKTLEPFPINTEVVISILMPNQPRSLTFKGKVAHIVYDRQRCEVDNGMGIQFMELGETQKQLLNLHILNEKMGYLELQKILEPERPNLSEVQRYSKNIPSLKGLDLLGLRYRVNRVCTVFEPSVNPFETSEKKTA